MDREELITKYGHPSTLSQGQVIQMHKDALKANLPAYTSAEWVATLFGVSTEVPKDVLRAKIVRLTNKASHLRGARLHALNSELFTLPQVMTATANLSEISIPQIPPTSTPITPILLSSPPSTSTSTAPSCSTSTTSSPPRTLSTQRIIRITPQKKANTQRYKIAQYERTIESLEKKVKKLREEVLEQAKNKAHYMVKNVKKREERNIAMRKNLREEVTKYKSLSRKKEIECEEMKKKLAELQKLNKKTRETVRFQKRRIKKLTKEKKNAAKRATFHKLRHKRKRQRKELSEEEEAKDAPVIVETRNSKGEYTVGTRFCVMELAGLEVAMGKMGKVMETVGDLAGVKFSHLPGSFGCQCMVDEGQVLAKRYIRDNVLRKTRSFGIHKDGTSRRQVKILDTSIRTEEGEAFSLGYSAVASETGEAISEEAKDKLKEVAGGSEEEVKEIVLKIAYFMSDRAANEKKSNRCLESWMKQYLDTTGDQDTTKIHHLFCAAHVLVGFHTNIINSLKKSDLFGTQDQKHPITIMFLDATQVFGPVGDYRGLRNQWQAFCLDQGIKSYIKNYKDNRFNGLFEVAAQVYHHHEDFLKLLEMQPSHNAKRTRLLKALQNDKLMLLSECLGIFFHSVTGPYWKMITTSSFEIFRNIIPKLKSALQEVTTNPSSIFDPQVFSFLDFPVSCPQTKEKLAKSLRNKEMEGVITLISSAMTVTLNAQLDDFLEGGKYHASSSKMPLPSAPLTNLISERHFGHLDASQKRRPNSSLHHHSSILMLKQTRKRLRNWFNNIDKEEQESLWKVARVEGKQLRKKHREHDQKAVTSSLKMRVRDDDDVDLHVMDELAEGQMIAVACADTWYPAEVKERCPGQAEHVTVSFAELGKGLGSFKWPTGKEIETVLRKSIVENKLKVEPRAGGRSWMVINAKEIQAKFKRFK